MTAPDTATRRFYRLMGWLLTPLVAWAVSFLGGWVGAAIARSAKGLLVGSVIGAVVGAAGWCGVMWRGREAPRADG